MRRSRCILTISAWNIWAMRCCNCSSANISIRRFGDAGEGQLTKSRARLVSGEALAVYARHIELGQHLMMGRGDESNGGRRRASTLADAFEALVGAMYLDGGLGAARSFVLTQARDQLASLHEQPPLEINPKGALQEILQALPPRGSSALPRNPVYKIISQAGPDHAKRFRGAGRLVRADARPRERRQQTAGGKRRGPGRAPDTELALTRRRAGCSRHGRRSITVAIAGQQAGAWQNKSALLSAGTRMPRGRRWVVRLAGAAWNTGRESVWNRGAHALFTGL